MFPRARASGTQIDLREICLVRTCFNPFSPVIDVTSHFRFRMKKRLEYIEKVVRTYESVQNSACARLRVCPRLQKPVEIVEWQAQKQEKFSNHFRDSKGLTLYPLGPSVAVGDCTSSSAYYFRYLLARFDSGPNSARFSRFGNPTWEAWLVVRIWARNAGLQGVSECNQAYSLEYSITQNVGIYESLESTYHFTCPRKLAVLRLQRVTVPSWVTRALHSRCLNLRSWYWLLVFHSSGVWVQTHTALARPCSIYRRIEPSLLETRL